jgi:hypothetical protein
VAHTTEEVVMAAGGALAVSCNGRGRRSGVRHGSFQKEKGESGTRWRLEIRRRLGLPGSQS